MSTQPIMFGNVVLPLPEGPTMTLNMRGAISRLMSRMAGIEMAPAR
jgi:hypothetical protein